MNIDMNKNKINIGVFFGSRNPEHEVSIITGQMIIAELKKLGYKVVPVYIDKKGRWFFSESLGALKFFTDKNLEENLEKMESCWVSLEASNNKLVLKNKGLLAKEISIDLAFPAFHGANGEDGTIQGLFELSNVPYSGCEVASSAITMDKIITKQIYKSCGMPTTEFTYFTKITWDNNKNSIIEKIEKLNWPVFIKPARLGSSIGIAKVSNREELENACEIALHYDNRIIVEESVENLMDITCAVLGNSEPVASLVQEAVFEGEHFNYEDKYLKDGGAQLGNAKGGIIIPARIDEKTTKEVQNMAVRIYKLFNCTGTARVDFLYDKLNRKVYANEINAMPGTLYHHLWKASGLELGGLIEKLISLAIEQHREKNKITSTFKSDILNFANSIKLQIKKEEKE
ncbi:MAG: D-alanine--D-alanine ligase family protein [Parcubacteria group bacterium]|jgi:D-alanine-D-alanine ligase